MSTACRDIVNRYEDLDRILREWFADGGQFGGLVHLGLNFRGIVQSEPRVFHEEMAFVLRRQLPVCIHATQTKPNLDDAADYERRGYLGPSFMFSHYLDAGDSDRAAMARTGASLTFSPFGASVRRAWRPARHPDEGACRGRAGDAVI